jgi:hypothetical protein
LFDLKIYGLFLCLHSLLWAMWFKWMINYYGIRQVADEWRRLVFCQMLPDFLNIFIKLMFYYRVGAKNRESFRNISDVKRNELKCESWWHCRIVIVQLITKQIVKLIPQKNSNWTVGNSCKKTHEKINFKTLFKNLKSHKSHHYLLAQTKILIKFPRII